MAWSMKGGMLLAAFDARRATADALRLYAALISGDWSECRTTPRWGPGRSRYPLHSGLAAFVGCGPMG